MRNRSNSGVRLDYYQRLVNRTILKHQNPVTGLLPASESNSHAWVRDNVYSIMAVWGLAQAYRKTADLDEDRAKAYELEQAVVKLMRGLLRCMLAQVDKLEQFKHTQQRSDSLHAKYCSKTGKTVVGDYEWGHLQIDATSLYILTLAQMTASGLQIIFTTDEVAFVQNLVFYIETAYRTPDYGIWERGDKTNHGLPELNSSSIGMAKAALEAINELDLFGARGGPSSVIHVLPDEAQQCQAILHSMLPRESNSKEIDAALLTVISYPAFAVDDTSKIDETRNLILEKLEGKYGCSRFLRDGYKTAREDPNRLHYEPWELSVFENIECQWPLFFAYLVLDGLFYGNEDQVDKFRDKLDKILLKSEDGIPLVPELYSVPRDKVDLEYKNPNSQKRDVIGKIPQMWGESMYILGKLVQEGFISPGELDPLNRRLVSEPKPDIVVQVVILAEDDSIQSKLADHDIFVQTVSEASPIQVYPARVLTQLYSLLGKNKRMGLTGRPSSEIGLLATSKLYMFRDQILAFIPQFLDQHHFYLPLDADFLVDHLKTDVEYLHKNWRMGGRPLFVFFVGHMMIDITHNPPNALIGTIRKLQSGYIAGTRVILGKVSDFLSTSCVTRLSFLNDQSQETEVISLMGDIFSGTCHRPRLLSSGTKKKGRRLRMKSSVHGIVRRSRSIQVDPEQIPDRKRNRETFLIDGTLHASLRLAERGAQGVTECYSDPTSPESDDDSHQHLHLKGIHQPVSIEPQLSPVGSPSLRRAFMHHADFHPGTHENVNIPDLVDQLNTTEVLNEQADIIHYLFLKKGADWETEVGEKTCTIHELLVELYEKAGHWKQWWLVRHTAGMLQKRVEELALAATDLLVRQKQLSVGLPPDREHVITSPLPPEELAKMIFEACGEDHSTASLTQELLIYLAMFIRTEPKLFREMLRLRVGLIIQVMASELARTLKCSGDDASEQLLNLSPFEMKTLLHHILSGKEFVINSEYGDHDDEHRLTITSKRDVEEASDFARISKKEARGSMNVPSLAIIDTQIEEEDTIMDRQGQWLRRRRLDGALNRVPVGFYTKVWGTLKLCDGLTIEGQSLPNSLTREMTAGEFKFALRVETVLNYIPQPEYRQLMVEALMVLTLLTENEWKVKLDQYIPVDKLVQEANAIFLKDQNISRDIAEKTKGAAGISLHLYDSAPSGQYGTMSYLCRALAKILPIPFNQNSELECTVA